MNTHSSPEKNQEVLVMPSDIDAKRLAEELHLEEYRLPEQYYTQSRELVRDIFQNFGLKTLGLSLEGLGDFLVENREQIMDHFHRYPDMWRWPLALTSDNIRDEITNPILQTVIYPNTEDGIGDTEGSSENNLLLQESEGMIDIITRAIDHTIIILCFAIFILRYERFENITQKYTGKKLDRQEVRSLIHDEGAYELETVWGSRYVSLMKKILGTTRAFEYIQKRNVGTIEIENRHFYQQEVLKYWRGHLPYERILLENLGSSENAMRDLEGLNFFLCQNHLYGYEPLVQGMISALDSHHDNWVVWIKRYIDKVFDQNSEVNKVFRFVFQISGDVFVGEQLSEEAVQKIPSGLHDIIQNALKKHLKKITPHHVAPKVHAIITQTQPVVQEAPKIQLTGIVWNMHENTLSFTQGVPEGTYKTEIRIYKNNKVVGFGVYEGTNISSLDLKKDTFQNQNISAGKPLILGQDFEYTPGEKYHIGITCVTLAAKTEEFQTNNFIIPRERKVSVIPPTSLPVRSKVHTILHQAPPTKHTTPKIADVIPQKEHKKDPKESEKHDLETAIEFFLEKSDDELQAFFLEHTLWNEEAHTLTLSIPIAELEDVGYTPSLLGVEEYGPLTQWILRYEKGSWISSNQSISPKIQAQGTRVFQALSRAKARSIIDNELSSLGLPPSENEDNHALRQVLNIQENIDIKKFTAGIEKLSNTYSTNGMPYTLYSKMSAQKKDKTPMSISLLSKGNWLATLMLQPTIEIKLNSVHNKKLSLDPALLAQRIENALLNFIFQFTKNGKGISGIVKRTILQEDTKKLREGYKRDLSNSTARLLIENPDGVTFSIIGNISSESLQQAIKEAQSLYGPDKVALLYRRNTYAFVGDTSICRPSQYRSDEDYISLNIPERRQIIKERVLKTLFNGKSGIQDRAPFLYGSAVYHALQLEVQIFQDRYQKKITQEDITDEFLREFIDILKSKQVLISYRDYCAGWIENLTDLCEG